MDEDYIAQRNKMLNPGLVICHAVRTALKNPDNPEN